MAAVADLHVIEESTALSGCSSSVPICIEILTQSGRGLNQKAPGFLALAFPTSLEFTNTDVHRMFIIITADYADCCCWFLFNIFYKGFITLTCNYHYSDNTFPETCVIADIFC